MRKHFTAYEIATGKILYTGTARSVEDQVDEDGGIGAVEGRGDPRTQRVVNGKIRMIPKRQRDAAARKRAMRKLRGKRAALLRDLGVTLNPLFWSTLTPAEQEAWRQYRQALLDLPKTQTDLDNITWPQPPS